MKCKARVCANGRTKQKGKDVCCYGCKYVCRSKCYSAIKREKPYYAEGRLMIINGFQCPFLKEENEDEV